MSTNSTLQCLACTFAIAVTISGCVAPSPSLPKSGRYVLQRDHGADTLDLRLDGRYVHTTSFDGSRFASDSGTWGTTVIDGRPHLFLDRWVLWEPPTPGGLMTAAAAGTWYPRPTAQGDGLYALPVDTARGLTFLPAR
jgi:hypothetical protein